MDIDDVRAYIFKRIAELRREHDALFGGQVQSYKAVRIWELEDLLNAIEGQEWDDD